MINFALEVVCSFLFAMSLIFIIVELRARFNKSFLIFGICNILLCAFCAIDIFIQYDIPNLAWTKLQHVIASFFVPFLAWHLLILLQKENMKFIKVLFFIATLFSLTFFSDIMLTGADNQIVTTFIYNFTFVPYILMAIIYLIGLIIYHLNKTTEEVRTILNFHLIGSIILSICGTLDLICMVSGNLQLIPVASCTVIGVLGFSLIMTVVFTERLSMLIRHREITFQKLREAYKELEEVRSLKELGQSTAIINHEINNYTCAISGYAAMLSSVNKDEKSRQIINKIAVGCKKITSFSQDILEFSKSRILVDKVSINLTELIRNCIVSNFPMQKESFFFETGFENDIYINGDWNKIEQVFVNIFKNSFEAEADRIILKMMTKRSVLLLVIEDDGIGCSEKQMDSLFKPFYTTKRDIRKHGTGLGMNIVRAIIESHGGHISAYTKNILDNENHGLILDIAFPLYEEPTRKKPEEKDNIVFIKEDVKDLAKAIRVFQNVSVSPIFVPSVKELDDKSFLTPKTAIVASSSCINHIRKKYGTVYKTHTLVQSSRHGLLVINDAENDILHMFSEAYVIAHLLNLPSQGKDKTPQSSSVHYKSDTMPA